VPDDLAKGEPQSGLDKVTAEAPAAEIYYPQLTQRDWINSYPLLIWRQPWLSPDSVLHWPQLIDIDRTPFVTWDKRVGQ
jgi:hypothetical protein